MGSGNSVDSSEYVSRDEYNKVLLEKDMLEKKNEELAKRPFSCPECEKCPACPNLKDYKKITEYNELNDKYVKLNTINNLWIGIAKSYVGDFINYVGYWFRFVNKTHDKKFHITTRGRQDGGGQIEFTAENTGDNNELFTVSPYGLIICKGNYNSIILADLLDGCDGNSRIRIVGVNDQHDVRLVHWKFVKSTVCLIANGNMVWDTPGYIDDVKEGNHICCCAEGPGREDNQYELVVKEGYSRVGKFDGFNVSTDALARFIICLVVLMIAYFVFRTYIVKREAERGGDWLTDK